MHTSLNAQTVAVYRQSLRVLFMVAAAGLLLNACSPDASIAPRSYDNAPAASASLTPANSTAR